MTHSQNLLKRGVKGLFAEREAWTGEVAPPGAGALWGHYKARGSYCFWGPAEQRGRGTRGTAASNRDHSHRKQIVPELP